MSLRRCVGWLPGWQFSSFADLESTAPAAVVSANKIVTVTPAAARYGVQSGQKIRWARSLCPKLIEVSPSKRLTQTFEPVLVAAESVMAGVTPWRPGLFFAPARGAAKWHGGEQELCVGLTEAIAEAGGWECRVGIATGTLSAILAAREQVIVPEGEEREYLAPRPLKEAVWARGAEIAKTAQLLSKFGIETLGQLAQLRRREVGARFGMDGLALHDLASGKDIRIEPAARGEQGVSVSVPCEEPASSYSQAAFTVRICILRFMRALEQKGLTCARVKISAAAASGKELQRTWMLDPGWGEKDLTDRVKWQLEAWTSTDSETSGPVQDITLEAVDLFTLTARQSALWSAGGKNTDSAMAAAHRIQALLGPRGATIPILQGGYDPRSRVALIPVGEERSPKYALDRPWPGQLQGHAPAWILEKPKLLTLVDETGRAVEITSRLALSANPVVARWERNSVAIQRVEGPYPVLDRWWGPASERSPRTYLRLRSAGIDMLAVWIDKKWWVDGFWEQSKIGRKT